MTSFDNTSAGAGHRLEAVQARLDRAVRSARARNAMMLILGIISIGLIGYYLWYANREFTAWDAEKVAMVGQSELVDRMPAAATELKRSLRAQAPQVIANGEQRLRNLPDQFAKKFQEGLDKQLTDNAPAAEDKLYEALKAGIAEADKHIAEAGGATGDDEAKFKSMLDTLAHVYGTESAKLVDNLHVRYKDGSSDIIDRLDKLAEGKDLNEQEQSQRTMIRNFLVLAREYHDQSTADGVVSVALPAAASDTAAPTTAPAIPAKAVESAPVNAPAAEPAKAPDAPPPDGAANVPAKETEAKDAAPASDAPAPAPAEPAKEAPASEAPAPAPAAP